ncbi:MAG: TrmB family transcriptional regulator [Gemmatimonadetes bacterium]|nr:TrmB family transcriptional regulator [Gemmatimonadota bacterium]
MPLERFGFTATESRAYAALVTSGPATGYGLAKITGLARANAYQALESLVRRGAARRTAAKPPRFIPVPPATLVAELERAVRRDLASLEQHLKELTSTGHGEFASSFEPIADAESLLSHADRCVASANDELLAVIGPWAAALYPTLERAAARSVSVRALALSEPAPRNAAVRSVAWKELISYWGGQPMVVVADRVAAVCGTIGTDGSASGMATRSPGVVPFLRHLLRRELAPAPGRP